MLEEYDDLALMPRAWKITHALRQYLPGDYEQALAIAWPRSTGNQKRAVCFGHGCLCVTSTVFFVAEYGLDHFRGVHARAQYLLTPLVHGGIQHSPLLERHWRQTWLAWLSGRPIPVDATPVYFTLATTAMGAETTPSKMIHDPRWTLLEWFQRRCPPTCAAGLESQ